MYAACTIQKARATPPTPVPYPRNTLGIKVDDDSLAFMCLRPLAGRDVIVLEAFRAGLEFGLGDLDPPLGGEILLEAGEGVGGAGSGQLGQ